MLVLSLIAVFGGAILGLIAACRKLEGQAK